MIKSEMVYKTEGEIKILNNNEYRGIKYWVVSYGTHPCCYIEIPKSSILYYEIKELNSDEININCHGGVTYLKDKLFNIDVKGVIIGWDYAHVGDFIGYDLNLPDYLKRNDKIWSTDELIEECKQVIDSIYKFGVDKIVSY